MKSLYIFLLLLLLYMLTTIAVQYLFFTDVLLQQTYGGQLAFERISEMFVLSRKWQWVGHAIIPFVILLRIFYTSVFLYIGIFFTELKVEFGKLFKIALLADFVYVLSGLAKLVILIFFKEVNTLEDLQFQPLSVMELLNAKSIDPLFVYPLSLINVFELGYFLVLAWLLVSVINEANEERSVNYGKSLKLVTASYGSGLFLWVVFVMFITLNLS